ncbi:DUF3021 family protein [Carnobacterium inhibens]|uniref:DUF3021 family protein n=2 Tax=Carnobacterium inhibens TaxID=147709 RepID=A0ABR7TBR5_9LACT|nr:DUF3021 family protein [Carnobacterium inhibens]
MVKYIKMRKDRQMKLFLKGFIRGAIPFIFMLVMSVWELIQGSSSDARTFLLNGLIIMLLGIASVIYEINRWNFSKQIIVHYITMLLTVFPILLLSGYYPLISFDDVLNVFLLFNKVGLMLFFATFIIAKVRREFRKRN